MAPQLTFKEIWNVRYAIVIAVIAAILIVVFTTTRLVSMFTPGGLVVSAKFDANAVLEPVSIGTSQTVAAVTEAQFVVPDITWLSATALVAAVVARALSYLIVIACAVVVCRNLTAGRAFTRQNTQLILTAGIGLFVGTMLVYLGTSLGLNGVLASLGLDAPVAGPNTPTGYWPSLFAGFALTILAIAFRAGERIQRDTEGLV